METRRWSTRTAMCLTTGLLLGCAAGDASTSPPGVADGAEDGTLAVEPRAVEPGDDLRVEHLDDDVAGIGFVFLSSDGLEWVVTGVLHPSEEGSPPRVYSPEEAASVEWEAGPALAAGPAYVVPVPPETEPGDHLVCAFAGVLPDEEQPAEHCAWFEVVG